MRLSFARLGLAESRAASLSVLRWGSKKHVPVERQQIRFASWWKLSDDGGSEGKAFGIKRESKEEEDKRSELTKEQRQRCVELKQQKLQQRDWEELAEEEQQELDFQKKAISSIRSRGWFPDELEEEAESIHDHSTPKSGPAELALSLMSEDVYWEETSRPEKIHEDAESIHDHSSPKAAPAELALSQMSEDEYWEETSHSDKIQEEIASTRFSQDPPWGLTGRGTIDASTSTEPLSTDDAHASAGGLTGDDVFDESTCEEAEQRKNYPKALGKNHASRKLYRDGKGRKWNPWNEVQFPRSNVYAEDSPNQGTRHDESLLNVNYVTQLPVGLEENDQDTVARCLYTAQHRLDFDFIYNIPEATFTEVLQVLEARRNIQNLSDVYKNTSEHSVWLTRMIPQEQLMSDHGLMLQEVAMIRRRTGRQLTADQYLILLRSARDLGQLNLATQLWEYMQQDGVVPDISLFNAYLSAFVWNGHSNPSTRHHDRVIDHYMLKRKARRGDLPYFNYSVGSPMGIKDRSMVILNAMLKNGIKANEETYREIITAAAREGEMDTVESILKITWNVSVSSLMQANLGDEEVPKPKELARDNPQYPTTKLLTALAHAFAINNNIPTALRLVDHMSREYEIPITTETWEILFEWTYVLSSFRGGTNARGDRKTGQLPFLSPSKLWETMTGAPYFVQPTISMYNHLIRNLLIRRSPIEGLAKMAKAEEIDTAIRHARKEAWATLERCVKQQQDGCRPEKPVAVARRQWEEMTVAVARNLRWKKAWMRLFFRSLQGWHRGSWHQDHSLALRMVPRVLWVWRHFRGSMVEYDLPTGVLEVHLISEKGILRRAVRNEGVILRREEILDKAKILVADDLLRAPRDRLSDQPVAASYRLRKERAKERRALHVLKY